MEVGKESAATGGLEISVHESGGALIAFTPLLLLYGPLVIGTRGRYHCIRTVNEASSLRASQRNQLQQTTGHSASGVNIVSSTLIFIFSDHCTQ
jgi:hypothetical protein